MLTYPLYIGEVLSIATFTTQFYGISDPLETLKGFTQVLDFYKNNLSAGKGDMTAKAGEYGAIFWKVLAGFRMYSQVGNEIRVGTESFKSYRVLSNRFRVAGYDEPVKWVIADGKYQPYTQISRLQKIGHFLANAHQGASTLTVVNTALSLGISSAKSQSGDFWQNFGNSAYGLAYRMQDIQLLRSPLALLLPV